MDENILKELLEGSTAINVGPNAKEIFLEQAESEYNNGNLLHSVFYQGQALFQAFQERYYQIDSSLMSDDCPVGDSKKSLSEELMEQMNDWEKENMKSQPLMQYALQSLKENFSISKKLKNKNEPQRVSCNFLQNILDPVDGIAKIEQICQQLPKEWTVLQLCKGPRADTTYSVYPQIHERDAAIYLTILRHVRTATYPAPVCLRFSGPDQEDLFKKFAVVANRFKQCILVDPKDFTTKQKKKMYWEILGELDQYIANSLLDLKSFFFPWNFLFRGIPYSSSAAAATAATQHQSKIFNKVDEFCDRYHWLATERVLLSLAAMHVDTLTELEVHAICQVLSTRENEQVAAGKLLLKLQSGSFAATNSKSNSTEMSFKHYPCMLVVDERLDHFFWEELNVQQEFCRVNSLQCLWRLYQLYRQRIRNGYLSVNITDGGCLVNPDNNLPKTELRMRRFFEYWTPHWMKKISEKPTQDELLKDFFKRSCYVYAGHGSGLQYINGKHIAKQQMNCVVFLFGCDSSRLRSSGLYSELIGPHLYYHAAMCPTLVGTLMPGLDANMDGVATEILSRWVAPKSKNVIPWQEIDRTSWIKEGVIKPKSNIADMSTIANTPDYQMGSLCAILARIHQRLSETKLYNTVPYVCRGLPVWNCNVQPMPK